MEQTNLLPWRSILHNERRRKFKRIILGLLLVMICLVICMHELFSTYTFRQQNRISRLQAKLGVMNSSFNSSTMEDVINMHKIAQLNFARGNFFMILQILVQYETAANCCLQQLKFSQTKWQVNGSARSLWNFVNYLRALEKYKQMEVNITSLKQTKTESVFSISASPTN